MKDGVRNPSSITVAVLSEVITCACASSGKRIQRPAVEAIQKGVTTENEVIQKFGPAQYVSFDQDGNHRLGYTHSCAETSPETFIPFIGPFVGGMNMQIQMLQIRIDKKGKVRDYIYTDSPQAVNMGMSAQ